MLLRTLSGTAKADACDHVNRTNVKFGAGVADAGAATGAVLNAVDVSAVAHSSGAAIVTTASSG